VPESGKQRQSIAADYDNNPRAICPKEGVRFALIQRNKALFPVNRISTAKAKNRMPEK
jgi:hypothetical protein